MAELPAPTPAAAWSVARLLFNAPTSAVNPATLEGPWDEICPLLAAVPVERRQSLLEELVRRAGYNGTSMRVLSAAIHQIDASSEVPPPDVCFNKHGIEVLTREGLRNRPKPTWLVDAHIPSKCLTVLYGPSGIGKSFMALAFAASICTGIPWFGREVDRGPVIYIAAEGDEGMEDRLCAWEATYNKGEGIADLLIIPQGLDFRQANTPANLLEATAPYLASVKPKLIIIDTLARNMTGDENSTEHMSQLVRQVDTLWQRTAATVLVIHHTGKAGAEERGNGSLRNAAHTMMKLTRDEESKTLQLTCDKQRNAAEFEPWTFRLKEQGESCVLDLDGNRKDLDNLPPLHRRILDVLNWQMHRDGISGNRLREVLGIQEGSGKTQMYRAINTMNDHQLLSTSGQARGQTFTITAKGMSLLSLLLAREARAVERAEHVGSAEDFAASEGISDDDF